MTCGGDSGGPLVIYNSVKEQYTQVGVVTGGSCNSYTKASIYARLEDEHILKFIYQIAFDMEISDNYVGRYEFHLKINFMV